MSRRTNRSVFDAFTDNNREIEMTPYWIEYDRKVREWEAKGFTRSDAQGIVDAEELWAGEDAARRVNAQVTP